MCERRGHIDFGHDCCGDRRITKVIRPLARIYFPIRLVILIVSQKPILQPNQQYVNQRFPMNEEPIAAR